MTQEKIQRINELYRKSQAEGLSEAEKKEQDLLRKEYIGAICTRSMKALKKPAQ